MSAGRRRQAFPCVPASAAEARRFLESVLTAPEHQDVVYTASLLLSELVANAVLHTGTPIEVVVDTSGPQVRVEVHDGSRQLPVRKQYSTMSGTGRGLMLVERMAAAWGTERTDGGKVVWFELDGEATPLLDLLEADAG